MRRSMGKDYVPRFHEIYASAYMENVSGNGTGTGWSEGVQITHNGKFNDEASCLVKENGELLVVNAQYDMQENEFYFATKEATIQENAETASLLKIERGGKAESAASVKVRFIDITSKIGKDYKLSLYQEGNGKSAEISGGQSVFEKMQESSDSMQEYNSSDEAVQSVKDPSAGDGTDTESDAAETDAAQSVTAESDAAKSGISDSESAAAGTEESDAATAASGTSAAGSPSESSLEITDNMQRSGRAQT